MTFALPHGLVVLAWAGAVTWALAEVVGWALRGREAALRHFIWMVALVIPLGAAALVQGEVQLNLPVLPGPTPPHKPYDSPNGVVVPADLRSILPPLLHLDFKYPPDVKVSAVPGRQPIDFWMVLWAVGAVIAALRLGMGHWRARRFLASSTGLASEELFLLAKRLAYWLDLQRAPRICVAETAVPFCLGVVWPVIVFPEAGEAWEQERRMVCLLHELAHIKRGDLAAQGLSSLACVLSWFNPFAWMAAARVRDEAENAADDVVMNYRVEPEAYAAHLVAITEACGGIVVALPPALSMVRTKGLAGRVTAILQPRPHGAPRPVMLIGLGVMAGALLFGLLCLRVEAKGPVDEFSDFHEPHGAPLMTPDAAVLYVELENGRSGGGQYIPALPGVQCDGGQSSSNAPSVETDYLVAPDVKTVRARFILHENGTTERKILRILPITVFPEKKTVIVADGLYASAMIIRPLKRPLPKGPAASPQLAFVQDIREATVPAGLRGKLMELQREGRAGEILGQPGVQMGTQTGGGLFADQPATKTLQSDDMSLVTGASSVTPDRIYLRGRFDGQTVDGSFPVGIHFQLFSVGRDRGTPAQFKVLLARALQSPMGKPDPTFPSY